MKRLVYSFLIAVLFVCAAVTSVSGQGFVFNMDPWTQTVVPGTAMDITRMSITVTDTLVSADIRMMITPIGPDAANMAANCYVSSPVKVFDPQGQLKSTGTIGDYFNTVPQWNGAFVDAGDKIQLSNIVASFDCGPLGLNGQGYQIDIVARGWTGTTNLMVDTTVYFFFQQPTQPVVFFEMGSSYNAQTEEVTLGYYLDRNGHATMESGVTLISPSGLYYSLWGNLPLNEGNPDSVRFELEDFGQNVMPENGTWNIVYFLTSVNTCQNYSIYSSFEMSGIVGTTESIGSKISMFPNPASIGTPVILNISGSEAVSAIQIWDMGGHKVKDIQPNTIGVGTSSIETADLRKGQYMVRCHYEGGEITTRKLLIQ